MSVLHKKFVALGDFGGKTIDDFIAACGEPTELKDCEFSDIGMGKRATWSERFFTITLNFDADGKYCGIYHHRNIEPYLWIAGFSIILIAALLIIGAVMRSHAAAAAAAGAWLGALC